MSDVHGKPAPCCPCDLLVHPPKPDIAAGLDSLPRQVLGFPEYRRAMLQRIPTHAALAGWRAREGDDLGIMLLEMWAYVLDVLAFYDERIANESYLRTAHRRPSLRRLVELVGYLPRPALGASVTLAAFADGPDALLVPRGTALRSQAFDGEPPQIFETSGDALVAPERNEWTIAGLRAATFDGRLLLAAEGAALRAGGIALFRLQGSAAAAVAARVTAVRPIEALDGEVYLAPALAPEPELPLDTLLDDVEVLTPALAARRHPLLASGGDTGATLRRRTLRRASPPAAADLILDGLYPQLPDGAVVVVERGGELRASTVTVSSQQVVIDASADPDVRAPATGVTFDAGLPAAWRNDPGSLTVHFQMIPAGRLTRPAEPWVGEDELRSAPLVAPAEPLEVAPPDEFFLHDAKERGARVTGSVSINGDGTGSVSVNEGELSGRLRAPVTVYGNLVAATRGESVFNEVLGSGDGSAAFQSFTLGKSPLTYFNDPAAPRGRAGTLTVRVNGLLWREVPSFFGTGPDDEVYIVRENDEHEFTVTFGDGERGARLPTGVDNVVAGYRYGAGAASPPANAITQLSRPVPGLRGVINPIAAGGGADADEPEDIRSNAPTSALTLGRAVSLLDFQALAREFGGVVNAQVDWAWDDGRQRAVVKVWFIGDGGDIAAALRSFLIGQAEPTTPLDVQEATPIAGELVIDLDAAPRFVAADVEQAVLDALTDPVSGLLAHANIPIGCPLFRSRIFERVLAVDGVATVRGASLDGTSPTPQFLTVPEGHYLDFLAGLTVGGTRLATAEGAAA
jgi:hypothetical protein